jgi:hypothetical protein
MTQSGGYTGGYFQGDRHALYVGWVAMHAAMNGLDVRVLTDEDGTTSTGWRSCCRPWRGTPLTSWWWWFRRRRPVGALTTRLARWPARG